MKPVEIEFLVKNNTRQGLSGVSGVWAMTF